MTIETISSIRAKLKARSMSVEECTREHLKHIRTLDKTLNAFITVTEDEAIKEAKAIDAKWSEIMHHPLAGVPIAHKDIFCTKGIRTSCGSKMLDNFLSPYDATVVRKLKDAYTILLGKTNMDEFAMGSSSETSFYGPSKNPWDISRVPGGSSSGSAVAVASGMVPIATGTDTGGSIRQPAALCGISGIKPTYGRVSRYGMIAYASSLDQGGPFAHTALDLAHLLNVMVGHDSKDSTSVRSDSEDFTQTLEQDLKGLIVGLPKPFFSGQLDPIVAQLTHEFAAMLEKKGVKLIDVDLPHVHLSVPAYYVVAPAECSSNLARYDGVRFGYRAKDPTDLVDLYTRSRGEGFGPEVKRRIMIGTYTLSSGYYDAYYLKAQKIRKLIQQDFVEAFKKAHVLLGPTTPSPAFKLGEKINDPLSMYLNDIYTVSINLAGLPALSIPIGFVNGLPIGGQLIGNYFNEKTLLQMAHHYQKETEWHLQKPSLANQQR